MIIDTEQYLSIHEAAAELSKLVASTVTPQIMQHFVSTGRIPDILNFKGRSYIRKDSIEGFKDEYIRVRKGRKDR